ncbi:hypothetical protein [Actinoplanes sp. GCM10030250]|uniref:hypothetical protein n=1 Tax=Actinoplanes sp. GCM10030250 TaxID=3273376 RepID=UPI003621D554
MEVVAMVFLILLIVGLIMAAGLLLSPQTAASAQGQDEESVRSGQADGDSGFTPTTLEGVLVAQLLTGDISRGQYSKALARLAERDDERNPMSVPGNDRPDACA